MNHGEASRSATGLINFAGMSSYPVEQSLRRLLIYFMTSLYVVCKCNDYSGNGPLVTVYSYMTV